MIPSAIVLHIVSKPSVERATHRKELGSPLQAWHVDLATTVGGLR